eukprot:TRINITY_DN980_c0_g5_i1.p2 TRINITY_DN980_c0_g5~~TRINITY_DN980_c0_g5_i1.p2  ORF type:complete len:113 (-),score=18.47 TRINITY_DN980_c0_g5_i1:265-603(-)
MGSMGDEGEEGSQAKDACQAKHEGQQESSHATCGRHGVVSIQKEADAHVHPVRLAGQTMVLPAMIGGASAPSAYSRHSICPIPLSPATSLAILRARRSTRLAGDSTSLPTPL